MLDTGTSSLMEFEVAIAELVTLANEPMFVWKLLPKLRLNLLMSRGQSPLYLISSPDIKSFITEFIRLFSLLFDASSRCEVADSGDSFTLRISPQSPSHDTHHVKTDSVMCLLLFLGREVIGDKFDFKHIGFPSTRENLDESIVATQSKATMSRTDDVASVQISKSLLAEKNGFFNPDFYNQLKVQVNEQLALENTPDSLTSRVTNILKNSDKPAAITLEQMAKAVNMSESSFRRYLQNEEVSYKKLQNRFLDELCIQELLNSDIKIDALAMELGYAERSTFERSFRNKFAMTPSQMRQLSKQYVDTTIGAKDLKTIVNELPPLSTSCRDLLDLANTGQLDLISVVSILNHDPVFSGRVMGLASRAIYGNPPRDIRDAVGRSLGLETVKNLAVLYSAKDCLSDAVEGINVEHFIQSMLVAPKLFQLFKRAMDTELEVDSATIDQTMMFGLLGLFLLCHQAYTDNSTVKRKLSDAPNLNVLLQELASSHISLLGATSLLLSFWGIDSSVIKILSNVERHINDSDSPPPLIAVILFTYDVVFCRIKGLPVSQEQSKTAEVLGIQDFDDLMEFLD